MDLEVVKTKRDDEILSREVGMKIIYKVELNLCYLSRIWKYREVVIDFN